LPTIQFITKINEEGVISTFEKIAQGIERTSDAAEDLGEKSGDAAKEMEVSWTQVGSTFALSGAAIAGAGVTIIGTLLEMADSTSKAGSQIYTLYQSTGLSATALSEWGYVASQQGTSLDAMTSGLRILATHMEDAQTKGGAAADTFLKLGISATSANGQLRPTQDVLLDVADKFSHMADGAEKSALAVELFGRGGLAMIPVLNLGRDGISELADQAHRLGIVFDKEAADKANQFEDTLDNLHLSFTGLSHAIGEEAYPILEKWITSATDAIVQVKDWAKENPDVVTSLLDISRAAVEVGAVLLGTGGLIVGIANLKTAWVALNLVMDANPISLSILAFVGLTTAALHYKDVLAAGVLGVTADLIFYLGALGQGAGTLATALGQTGLGKTLTDAGNSILKTSANLWDMRNALLTNSDGIGDNTAKIQDFIKAHGIVPPVIDKVTLALKQAEEEAKRHADAVASLTASVIPTTAAEKDLAGAILLLQGRGLTLNQLLPEMGKQASDMASKFHAAGITVNASVQALASSFDFKTFLDNNTKQINDWSHMISEINTGLAKTSAASLEKFFDDETKLITSGMQAVADASKNLSASNAAFLVGEDKLIAGFQASLDQVTTAQYESDEKKRTAALDAAQKQYEAHVASVNTSIEGISATLHGEALTWGNITDTFFDHFHQGALTMGNVAKDAGEKIAGWFIGPIQNEFETFFNKTLNSIIDAALGPLREKLTSLTAGFLDALGGDGGYSAALAKAGFSADNVVGAGSAAAATAGTAGGGTLASIGAFATNPITLAVAGSVLGITGLIKSMAHFEANDLVKNFQNPFDQQFAGIINAVTTGVDAGTIQPYEATNAQQAMYQAWSDVTGAVIRWEGNSSDRKQVGDQFFATESPFVNNWLNWIDSIVRTVAPDTSNTNLVNTYSPGYGTVSYGTEVGTPLTQYAMGTPWVPWDGAYFLHQGERVTTAAQNRGSSRDSGRSNITVGDIHVYGTATDSPADTGRKIREEIIRGLQTDGRLKEAVNRAGSAARV
jgi:hypothetical protein